MTGYRSPTSGRPLRADASHALCTEDGEERWPIVDGIPYLRTGSEARAAEAVRALDAGDTDAALLLLLPENDRWWDGAPPPEADLRRLLAERDRLTLRVAMDLLGWGRVGTYFAHRWGDPTYLAGLALLDAHWPHPRTAFELACGIGHYLRALGSQGVRCMGADLVFAKLWVARHWVAPQAQLVCFDAEAPWPVEPRADLAFCHDAFYFFQHKASVAVQLRAAAPAIAISHVHNSAHANYSCGAAIDRAELDDLFPGARLYADEALTAAAVACRAPTREGLDTTEAFALFAPDGPPRPVGALTLPCDGAPVRRNPLLGRNGPAWPSERYAAEYGPRATFRADARVPDHALMTSRWTEAAARRELVELPERW